MTLRNHSEKFLKLHLWREKQKKKKKACVVRLNISTELKMSIDLLAQVLNYEWKLMSHILGHTFQGTLCSNSGCQLLKIKV